MDNSKILSDSLKESRTFQFLEKYYDIIDKPLYTNDEEFFILTSVLDFTKAIIADFGYTEAERLGNLLVDAAKNCR